MVDNSSVVVACGTGSEAASSSSTPPHPQPPPMPAAYDMNPDPNGTGLRLNISEADNALDLELAMEVAEVCRVDHKTAGRIVAEVSAATATWRDRAARVGLSRAEQDRMEQAFQRAGSRFPLTRSAARSRK